VTRSLYSNTLVHLRILNQLDVRNLKVCWVDKHGNEVFLEDLAPGHEICLKSFSTHVYKIRLLSDVAVPFPPIEYVCTAAPQQICRIRDRSENESRKAKVAAISTQLMQGPQEKSKQGGSGPIHPGGCRKCGKSPALLPCHCGHSFCVKHVLGESHDCDFDYKSSGSVPVRVVADKLKGRI
jgi:hypothetical protein